KLGRNPDYHNYFITENITDKGISSSLDNANIFPLYRYPETNGQQTIGENITERKPNFNAEIVNQIAAQLGLTFVEDDKKIPEEYQILVEVKPYGEPFIRPYDWGYHNCFTPIDLLDYIYAVLHSPTYREKYKEFLKIDFPRIPYP